MIADSSEDIGPRTDVYLLGAVLHEVITGAQRHKARSIVEALFSSYRSEPFTYDPSVPKELGAIANRATSARPENRYEDADAVRVALADFLKHESSREISKQAAARLAELREKTPADTVAAYKLFGECRFGFTQALRAWPENVDARQGLEDGLELMLDYELARDNVDAAAALAAELHAGKKLEAVHARIAEKQRAVEKMRRIAADQNLDTGRRTRAFLAGVVAFTWSAVPIVFGASKMFWNLRPGYGWYSISFTALAALVVFGTWWARYSLGRTAVNRRIAASIYLIGGGVILTKIAGLVLGLELEPTLLLEMIVFAAVLGTTAIGTDRRLAWSAIVYVAGFTAASLRLDLIYFIMAATHFGAFACAALLWTPRTWADLSAPVPE